MAKIFLHTKKQNEINWTSEYYQFERVPAVGEYLVLRTELSWYEVRLVLHTPFKHGCEGEIYAVRTIKGQDQITKKILEVGATG